jgi:hypothetical protein
MVLAGGSLALAGCGSGAPPAPPPPPPPVTTVAAASATAAPVPSATAAASVTAAPVPSATPQLVGGVPVEDLCAFLAADVPKLQQQPSVGSVARLASDLTDFYASLFLPRPDGVAVDRATETACPAVRGAVLYVLGQPNLRSL